ncbi:hypothetical protein EP47_06510 [Legionella norrlandica]|uniref:23, 7 kDa protein n=1 Tax=Legionella norrlandica TaxID=1498499 RepID=A0A0A2SVX7_9GAMM|nr:hypothetical protein [Legionella norrlandica]KGP63604.1 hypothetical protein EP47_06510 [Legionella norrlandica]
MSHFLFHSYKSQESIDQLIDYAESLLADIDIKKKTSFLTLLKLRVAEFQKELSNKTLNTYDKQQTLSQYEKFAKTLISCMERPQSASLAISHYHNNFYYPVGVQDKIHLSPEVKQAALAAVGISMALLIGSIPAFVFNPLIGTIMLSLAITLLLPSSFCLLTPDSPDTTRKKEQEKLIFKEGAKLINPDVLFEESDNKPYISSTLIRV